MNASRDLIRPIVRGAYNLQSLRVQTGNRVCAAFKFKLGQLPSVSEEDALSAEAKKLLDDLRSEYKLLGSAVAQFKKTKGDPKPFAGGKLIESETELVLVEQYLDLEDQEKRAAELKGEDLRRYERVMAEIDKDEAESMERLKQIRIRRAIVKRAGHHG